MYSKSNNIKVEMGGEIDEIIEVVVDYLLQRHTKVRKINERK